MNNLNTLTTSELSDLIRNGDISSEELVRATLDSIQSNDNKINSFITVNKEDSIEKAKKVDKEMKNNSFEKTFLTGIPILIKDNNILEVLSLHTDIISFNITLFIIFIKFG